MAQCVIDGLEVVEVDVEQRAEMPALCASRQRYLQTIDQEAPVGEVGQAVVVGQMQNALRGLLLGSDVFLHRHVVGDLASRVPDRTDDGQLRVLAAILTPVEKFTLPNLAGLEGFPKFDIGLGRRLFRLEDARVLADDLFAGVAGTAQEGLIDVFDAALNVGDGNTLRALLDGERELADLVDEGQLFGTVAHDIDAVGEVACKLFKQLDLCGVKGADLGSVHRQYACVPGGNSDREGNARLETMFDRTCAPDRDRRVGQAVLVDLHESRTDGGTGWPLTPWVVGPGDFYLRQVLGSRPVPRYRTDDLPRVVFGPSNPSHPVASGLHDQAANPIQ